MRVLICGDRNWTDRAYIHDIMTDRLSPGDVVIAGGARGADTIAAGIGTDLGLEVEVYPANWERYGKAAGPVRNIQMVEEGKPDEVWAFHHDLEKSKGTKHMVEFSRSFGVTTEVFTYGEDNE